MSIGNRFWSSGGVGLESEAESMRFHGRRVTKVNPKVKAADGGWGQLNKWGARGPLERCRTFQVAENAMTRSVSIRVALSGLEWTAAIPVKRTALLLTIPDITNFSFGRSVLKEEAICMQRYDGTRV